MPFAQKMETDTIGCLEFEGGNVLGVLFPWFQSGVWVLLPAESTVGLLLTQEWGLDPESLDEKLGTVFLNGTPLDDMESAFLCDGDVLALSGPMPGLAGAILRRNSPLAVLRHGCKTTSFETSPKASGPILVRVKLFNRLIEDLGPILLRKGILLEKDDALQCLRTWKYSERAKPTRVWLNREEVSFENLELSPIHRCSYVEFRLADGSA
ncbi:MAG: hypothetical protein WHS46_11925 [Desulfosoma sp.]